LMPTSTSKCAAMSHFSNILCNSSH
jgi:hypothetical protein